MIKLETERLLIQSWSYEDISDIVRLFKDSKLIFGNAPFPYTKEDAISWLDSMKSSSDVINLSIKNKFDKRIIGLFFISQINKTTSSCVIGLGFEESARGKCFASEVMKTIIKFIKNSLNLSKIKAENSDWNIASQNLLKKFGFKLVEKSSSAKIHRFMKIPNYILYWELNLNKKI